MIRTQTQHGWWLTPHSELARLAGAIAREWGGGPFRRPEPRNCVLSAVLRHQDAMRVVDAAPQLAADITPLAVAVEQLGRKISLDGAALDVSLAAILKSVRLVAADDPYASLLVAMQAQDRLTRQADRTPLTVPESALLDRFLRELDALESQLREEIEEDPFVAPREKSDHALRENFHLLLTLSHLALLLILGVTTPAELPHPVPLQQGGSAVIRLLPLAPGHFRLDPWPLAQPEVLLSYSARLLIGHRFTTAESFAETFAAAGEQTRLIRLTA